MDIRKVKKLIELLEESNIDEIEIKEGEESVRISRHSSQARAAYAAGAAAEVLAEASEGGISVRIARADGHKCERCWHYETDIGQHAAHPSLCGRCVAVLG